MPEFNPVTIIVADLQRWLQRTPFEPFLVKMSNGTAYPVPTSDHLVVTKILHRVTLETDDGRAIDINPLHVASIESLKNAA